MKTEKAKKWMFLIMLCAFILGVSAHARINYDQKAKEAQAEFQKLSQQIEALERRKEQLKGRFQLLVELQAAEEEAAEEEKDSTLCPDVLTGVIMPGPSTPEE